jgi:hypothetical protein
VSKFFAIVVIVASDNRCFSNVAAVGCTLLSLASLRPFANASLLRANSFLASILVVGSKRSILALFRACIAAKVGFTDRINAE